MCSTKAIQSLSESNHANWVEHYKILIKGNCDCNLLNCYILYASMIEGPILDVEVIGFLV